MQNLPRVAIVQVIHESNTFAQTPTRLQDFRILRGTQMVDFYTGAHNEVTGYLEGAAVYGYTPLPLFSACATPAGTVQAAAFDWLSNELITQLKAAEPFDGILLSLHGALVSDNFVHGDGELASRVRAAFPNLPIVMTHDPHGNISQQAADAVDALIIYKTNPHIDQRERGLQAGKIMAAMLRGEAKPTQAFRAPPMLTNIVHQHTSSPPLRDLWRQMDDLERQPGVLAVSMSLGYQYADVPALGNVVTVVTNNDAALAARIADDLAAKLWALRESLEARVPGIDEAVQQASSRAQFPQVIVDVGDNVGGGSTADSTHVFESLLRQNIEGWVVVLADPEAVLVCSAAGIGAHISLVVGGKTDDVHGRPVPIAGRVKCLHDGKYEERAARHGGVRWHNQGLSAVIEFQPQPTMQASYLVLTTEREAPMSLHQLTSVGIDPTHMKILVVKAAIAWKAAYEPIMQGFVFADSPGATQVNPRRWVYTRARKDLWGIDGW